MKKGFTLVELGIAIAIISLLIAIALPNFFTAKCKTDCANGNCSADCQRLLPSVGVLKDYDDMADVEVFCKIMNVSTDDFIKSKSLRDYYEEFKKGRLVFSSMKQQ